MKKWSEILRMREEQVKAKMLEAYIEAGLTASTLDTVVMLDRSGDCCITELSPNSWLQCDNIDHIEIIRYKPWNPTDLDEDCLEDTPENRKDAFDWMLSEILEGIADELENILENLEREERFEEVCGE